MKRFIRLTKYTGLSSLLLASFVLSGCIGMKWTYAVIYTAKAPEIQAELTMRLKEDPGILGPAGPYFVGGNSVAYHPEIFYQIIITTSADLQNTKEFADFRAMIEKRLGPHLMKSLKVSSEVSPQA